MPLTPAPTIPYPSMAASGPALAADWCASMLEAHRSHIGQLASAVGVMHAYLQQVQWIADGGMGAGYPLPLASGPSVPLAIYGTPAQMSETPAPTFFASPAWGSQ